MRAKISQMGNEYPQPSPDIRPVWTDREKLSHRMCGFAMTVRYFPTDQAYQLGLPEDDTMRR